MVVKIAVDLPTTNKTEQASNELNKEINDVLGRNNEIGALHGRVCLLCDRLLKKKETNKELQEKAH